MEGEGDDERASLVVLNASGLKMRGSGFYLARGQKEDDMIGMSFVSFLILLIISVVVSAVLHFVLKMYIVEGWRSYISKVCIGWVGAWIGSPVLGYWWFHYEQVYIIPAILSCFAILIVAVDVVKTCSTLCKKEG
jgi:uncharacterized membrane protein YeaQ/YmgE (transglycosylase-associated protein family)